MTQGERTFRLGAVNWKSVGGLLVFVAAVLLSIAIGLNATPDIEFAVAASGVFLLLMLGLLAATKAALTNDRLVVRGLVYKVALPWERVEIDRVVRLAPADKLKLRWRKNGVGWPGFCLGWFSSNQGREIFAAMSGRRNMVYIPTRENFDIVVTPVDPDAFVAALLQRARGGD